MPYLIKYKSRFKDSDALLLTLEWSPWSKSFEWTEKVEEAAPFESEEEATEGVKLICKGKNKPEDFEIVWTDFEFEAPF